MTTEQLLAPRFKVKEKYPGMEAEPFRLEQIITLTKHETDGWIHIPIKHIPGSYMRIGFFESFPNIFEPLPWWKERKIEDMPEYVKHTKRGVVLKVNEHCITGCKINGGFWAVYDNLLPATLEEYKASTANH